MIHSTKQQLTLSVPITLSSHHKAQTFYQRHADPCKAKQIYLNTLAVESVHTYLSWLGIASDLHASDSWNPVMQTLADIADLEIVGRGKLECRPVLPGATTCAVPPETNAGRIGYLPVLLDENLETATLLGFIPSADIGLETQAIVLNRLQPVTSLFEYLQPQSHLADDRAVLSQWLKEAVSTGWQSVETLLAPQPMFSFRSLELSNPDDIMGAAVRGKVLELTPPPSELSKGLYPSELRPVPLSIGELSGQRVALIVSISPTGGLESNIWIRFCPVGGAQYLPDALEVRILDDQSAVVMEALSRQTDMIQLHFRGMANEQFSVEVALNGVTVIEKFVI